MPDSPQIAADRALIASVLAGLAPATTRLLEQVEQQVRRLVRRNFPPAHREDLIHDFLTLLWEDEWRRLRQWRAEAPLAHYLARLFANFQTDRMRAFDHQAELKESLQDLPQVWGVREGGDQPDTAHELQELRDCLDIGTTQITPRQRTVLELRYGEGFNYAQIGEELGVTPGTVGSNLADAEKALRRRMQGECAELLDDILGTQRKDH
jgi:RNA polymerase sigma factor (sigma-70 family)